MSERQWQRTPCPNCSERADNHHRGQTAHFTGMVSLCMVKRSWVAQYNRFDYQKPGVYAIRTLQDSDSEDDGDGMVDHDYPDRKKNQKKKRNIDAGKRPDQYSDDREGFYSDEDEHRGEDDYWGIAYLYDK